MKAFVPTDGQCRACGQVDAHVGQRIAELALRAPLWPSEAAAPELR